MVELQLLTGMRPGEACAMRTCDIDTGGRVWVYRPPRHKTAHHGTVREVRIGPKAQELLRPFLRTDLRGFLFSPAEAEAERLEARRKGRKSPLTPSQRERAEKARGRPRRRGGRDHYDRNSYRRAIARACEKAFGMPDELRALWLDTPDVRKERAGRREAWHREHGWHPNQLRHNAATLLRRQYGIDAARIILGHTKLETTAIYAEADVAKAERIVAEVG